jgi:hypothetical protein
MSDPAPSRPDSPTPDPAVTTARRLALNEDWAATVVGLLLLALVLTGLLPGWLVP